MSQNAAVLARLREGPLTPREALDELGCFRLAARIHDLRLEGHLILAETVKAGGKSFARYQLLSDPFTRNWTTSNRLIPAREQYPEPDEREGAGSAGTAMTPAPGQLEVW